MPTSVAKKSTPATLKKSVRSRPRTADSLDAQEALLLQQLADVQSAIETKKHDQSVLKSKLTAVAQKRQEAEETRLGKLAFAAGLGGYAEDNLAAVFMVALDFLKGDRALQLAGEDGLPLVRTEEEDDDVS